MERYLIKSSNIKYDKFNSVEDALGEYDKYTSIISDADLKKEFKSVRSDFLSLPINMNVRKYLIAKQKMRERGLLTEQVATQENGVEMQNY